MAIGLRHVGEAEGPKPNLDGVLMVYADNLNMAFDKLRPLAQKYKYVAVDCVWPGNAARPVGDFASSEEFQYQAMRCNVTLNRLLQCSLSLFDENGQQPSDTHTFTFNFKFNSSEDYYVPSDLDRIIRAGGVTLRDLNERGIDRILFGALMITSGMICFEQNYFLFFNGLWDVAALVNLLLRRKMPHEPETFHETTKYFFKRLYDLRVLGLHCPGIDAGSLPLELHAFANAFDFDTSGYVKFQSMSDVRLVGLLFFEIRSRYDKAGEMEKFDSQKSRLFEYRSLTDAAGKVASSHGSRPGTACVKDTDGFDEFPLTLSDDITDIRLVVHTEFRPRRE